jgi:hypothetical protein
MENKIISARQAWTIIEAMFVEKEARMRFKQAWIEMVDVGACELKFFDSGRFVLSGPPDDLAYLMGLRG